MTRFPMRWDRTLGTVTVLSCLVLVAVPCLVVTSLLRLGGGQDPVTATIAAAVTVGSAATLGLAWALAPRALVLTHEALRVERPLRPVVIPLRELTAVAELPPGGLRGALRLMGNGGLFGYHGAFRSRALGAFRLYATRRDRLVRVDTRRGRFVLSADHPAALVQALQAAAPWASHAAREGEAEFAPARAGWRTFLPLLLAVGLVPVAVGVALGASWAGAPAAIAVRDGAVQVARRFSAPVTVPLDGAQVRPVQPGELRGLRRELGVALGRLRYGRYSSSALGAFQLWAHVEGPLVLVERGGERTVLSPDDPAAFLEAARQVPGCEVVDAP